jgi:tRNA 5-methylaminomethyl-2-thiouridine biosynthesis bifunctional protein
VSSPLCPIETADLHFREGLPFSTRFEDIYFCKENGLNEALTVFIEGNNLLERWPLVTDSFVIGETGFGCGLNFLLCWSLWLKSAPAHSRLHFISCEKFPLTREELKAALGLWPELTELALQLCENYPLLTPGFHRLSFADGRVQLTLLLGDALTSFRELLISDEAILEAQLRNTFVDAWFLDGFSPRKNPSMWSLELCQVLAMLSKKGTTLATYSAAAAVKKNLQAAGFQVQKKKGFGPKRHRVIGQFEAQAPSPKRKGKTPWHWGIDKVPAQKKAIIIGAGLAGCYSAYALATRGWQITLLEAQDEAGLGASANPQAVLYPKLSAFQSPLTAFMLSAFLFAKKAYQPWVINDAIGNLSGMLQLAYHEKEALALANLKEWLGFYPELGTLVDADEASRIAGIPLNAGGLFVPGSGWINSLALCQKLTQTQGIDFIPNTPVCEIAFDNGLWHAGAFHAEVLVIANGYSVRQFNLGDYLPIKTIRGQMTQFASNEASSTLRVPLCGDGHVVPAQNGVHAVGASYHLNSLDTANFAADEISNLAKLNQLAPLAWSDEIQGNWTGIRAATTDYLPLVGAVPDEVPFKVRFAPLATNSKRWVASAGSYREGLYLCTGFGSRGLTSIPLCAEHLASLINKEFSPLSTPMAKSLAPARFLIKEMSRGLKRR